MDVLVHELFTPVPDLDGHLYRARVMGRERRDGTWTGWLEFSPRGSGGVVRRTRTETTQPRRLALRYWALGLELVYLEGALARALRSKRTGQTGSSR